MSRILKGLLNEVNPQNYDSDIDYYNALNRKPRSRPEPDSSEPEDPYQDMYRKQDAEMAKYKKEVNVQYADKEGVAPNGERYNGAFIVRAKTPYQGDNEIYKFNDAHWGAKKIVDTVKKQPDSEGEPYTTIVYYVDNHKHGYWKPWKDEPPISKGIEFTEEIMREGISQEDLADLLFHRLELRYPDVVQRYGHEVVGDIVLDVAGFHEGAEELGTSDIGIMIRQIMRKLEEYANEQINELSPQTLASYKQKAGADASAADKRGDYKRGDKRMSGIIKATKKEFDNDAKGVAEGEKNPHTSALGKALYRDLSKEKKASPQQVQRNKERWAKRQAEREQGVAEGLRGTGNPGMPTPDDQGRDDAKRGRAYDNPYDQPGEEQEHSQYKKGYEQGKKQGVTAGSEQIYNILALDKGNALKKPTKLKWKASSLEDIFDALAAQDWYPLEINGVEVIAGKRLKQGVAEGSQTEGEATLAKIAASGDDGYEMIYDGLNGLLGTEAQIILQDMYDDISREHRLHPDDDFELIQDRMMDRIENDYGVNESYYDRGDYYNARMGGEYGKNLAPQELGSGHYVSKGDGEGPVGRPPKKKGITNKLPADPFGRTSGAVPKSTGSGKIHRISGPDDVDEGMVMGVSSDASSSGTISEEQSLEESFNMRFEEIVNEDWQKVNKKDKTDGMSRKAVKAYRRENPGSKLKTAVTTKPSKLKKGSKSAKRRKSFCARMSGMKKAHASAKTKRDPDSPINKALRRWNCESVEQLHELMMIAEQKVKQLREAANPAQQAAIAISKKKEQGVAEEKQRLDPKCWTGYKKQGTKMKGDTRVNNCVPIKKESAIEKGIVDENLGLPNPGTYEQETAPIRRKGQQERVQKIAFENKK